MDECKPLQLGYNPVGVKGGKALAAGAYTRSHSAQLELTVHL